MDTDSWLRREFCLSAWTGQASLSVGKLKHSSGCKCTRVIFGGFSDFTVDKLKPFLLFPPLPVDLKSHITVQV